MRHSVGVVSEDEEKKKGEKSAVPTGEGAVAAVLALCRIYSPRRPPSRDTFRLLSTLLLLRRHPLLHPPAHPHRLLLPLRPPVAKKGEKSVTADAAVIATTTGDAALPLILPPRPLLLALSASFQLLRRLRRAKKVATPSPLLAIAVWRLRTLALFNSHRRHLLHILLRIRPRRRRFCWTLRFLPTSLPVGTTAEKVSARRCLPRRPPPLLPFRYR